MKHDIWLVQRQYALDMLEKYGMIVCKLMSMPLEQNEVEGWFGSLVRRCGPCTKKYGWQINNITTTRPNLFYVMGLVSQFIQSPMKPHLDAGLSYVKTTAHYGLFYEYGKEVKLYGYTDANWVGSSSERRSISGYIQPRK